MYVNKHGHKTRSIVNKHRHKTRSFFHLLLWSASPPVILVQYWAGARWVSSLRIRVTANSLRRKSSMITVSYRRTYRSKQQTSPSGSFLWSWYDTGWARALERSTVDRWVDLWVLPIGLSAMIVWLTWLDRFMASRSMSIAAVVARISTFSVTFLCSLGLPVPDYSF